MDEELGARALPKRKQSRFSLPLVAFVVGATFSAVTLLLGSDLLHKPSLRASAQYVDLHPSSQYSLMMYGMVRELMSPDEIKKFDLSLADELRKLKVDPKEIQKLVRDSNDGNDLSGKGLAPYERKILVFAVAQVQEGMESL